MTELSDTKTRIEQGRQHPRRLLVPVSATERSQWPLRYALARRREVDHVDLLTVAEPITNPQLLRFRTQAELAELQSVAARWLLEHASKQLEDVGLRVACHFREGEIIAEILDAAEQLGCDAIVLPAPRPFWVDAFRNGIVRKLMRRPRATAVILVNRKGMPIAAERSVAAERPEWSR